MSKRWWNDAHYKAQLEAKVSTGTWHVVAGNEPGKVISIVYAGYKIQLPDGSTTIVSPDKLGGHLKDVTPEEYAEHTAAWDEVQAEKQRAVEAEKLAREALLAKQEACLHDQTVTHNICSAAGCDIYDTYCSACDKTLRRSWSTAYDKDPNDLISDWDWWVRDHQRKYGVAPERSSYDVVPGIGKDL